MEKYIDIVSRLSIQLVAIEQDLHLPLSETANNYRISAEAICKAIIIGNGSQPTGLLEKLIADSTKCIASTESSRHVGIFKSEIKYLQGIGNTYSHDGAGSDFANKQTQSAARDSLIKVVRVVFFGESDLDPPVLPKSMEAEFPSRILGRVRFENPRAEEVVRLCFPKQRVTTKLTRSDHANRLVYDYVVADLGAGLSKGFLFMRSRTAIEKSLLDFLAEASSDFPSALEIITPRAYRPDGKEIDRRKSIQDFVQLTSLNSKNRRVQVLYFDDFVWESCLPESVRSGNVSAHLKTNYFIEQKLEPIAVDGMQAKEAAKASKYIANILENAHEFDPVQLVIGPAGIGKTTFCDQISTHINAQRRKRVVLLSATDFREISNSTPIESVSDLYRVAAANGLMDEESAIEGHNFEINLACGNFVLLIDGFDELESHLGDSLNFDKFMLSLAELEDCFHRVLVIMTVRDYDVERYRNIRQTSICRLRGFSSEDTDQYLQERLGKSKTPEAKKLLLAFNADSPSELNTTIPLYVSLVCDYLAENTQPNSTQGVASSKFFVNSPLDTLVRKIVDREITKQSLGDIGADDFFDILIEIIRAPQYAMTKSGLVELVKSCGGNGQDAVPTNFMRNPFLRWERDTIFFKYDSLTYFFKSRLLARRISEGLFAASPCIEFMGEFHRGEGPLFDEFVSVFPPSKHAESTATKVWFKELIRHGNQELDSCVPWRKTISAFMYWALRKDASKLDRSTTLSNYFGGSRWDAFSVFGPFYALDLTEVKIHNGHLENYTNLQESSYKDGIAVFNSTKVEFDQHSLPDKLDSFLFAADCTLSSNVAVSFKAQKLADEAGFETMRDNIYKVLKVGFRANKFLWKSKDVYKVVTVVGKYSLDAYLSLLCTKGVLSRQPSRTGVEIGYCVTDDWRVDARKLIEEKNVTNRMQHLIFDFPNSIH